VGVKPTEAKVRGLVTWMAGRRETNDLKPIDKAIFGMVSESPGRNASEPTSSLVRNRTRRSSPLVSGEDSMAERRLTDAIVHSGGVAGAARWQGNAKKLEKPSSSHREIGGAR
jgi:hypothetical protein